MLLHVVDQLASAKIVNLVEGDTPRNRLPLEIVKFVKTVGFLPSFVPEHHAPANHVAVVALYYGIPETHWVLVILTVVASIFESLYLLLYQFLALLLYRHCRIHIHEWFPRGMLNDLRITYACFRSDSTSLNLLRLFRYCGVNHRS